MKMSDLKIVVPMKGEKEHVGLKRVRKGFKPLIFLGLIKNYEETYHEFKDETRIFFEYPTFIEKLIFRIIIGEKQNEHNCKEVTNEL